MLGSNAPSSWPTHDGGRRSAPPSTGSPPSSFWSRLWQGCNSTNPLSLALIAAVYIGFSVAGKRWKDGTMALRWAAAGMIEAGKQFRRVNGHLHLPALRAALERETAQTVAPLRHDEDVNQPDQDRAATEVPRASGQPRSLE